MSKADARQGTGRSDAGGGRRRLGRGLAALISEPVSVESGPTPTGGGPAATPEPAARVAEPLPATGDRFAHLALESIRPNPRQPRTRFDDEALKGLAESIRTAGLMQPVLVREALGAEPPVGFELVAGERRWRAAALAGLATIPAIVRELDDQVAAELALVENLQREDLDPIERAEAFRRLQDEFALRHHEIAERVGIDRSNVTNHLRLLDLPRAVREAMQDGRLSMGHGRTLLGLESDPDRVRLGEVAIREGWSVRQLEQRVREIRERRGEAAPAGRPPTPRQLHLEHLSRRIETELGTKVALVAKGRKGGGELRIAFYDHEQFEGLLERLGVRVES